MVSITMPSQSLGFHLVSQKKNITLYGVQQGICPKHYTADMAQAPNDQNGLTLSRSP